MPTYYLDASAVVKRYVSEMGSAWVQALCSNEENTLVAIERAIIDRAVDLTQSHYLRGYDAVHLATALTMNAELLRKQLLPLIFVAADNDLLKAAEAEGLPTENPNLYS